LVQVAPSLACFFPPGHAVRHRKQSGGRRRRRQSASSAWQISTWHGPCAVCVAARASSPCCSGPWCARSAATTARWVVAVVVAVAPASKPGLAPRAWLGPFPYRRYLCPCNLCHFPIAATFALATCLSPNGWTDRRPCNCGCGCCVPSALLRCVCDPEPHEAARDIEGIAPLRRCLERRHNEHNFTKCTTNAGFSLAGQLCDIALQGRHFGLQPNPHTVHKTTESGVRVWCVERGQREDVTQQAGRVRKRGEHSARVRGQEGRVRERREEVR
jgi:hypothetical protein